MKKLIVASFAFMFLLGVVAGCPKSTESGKPSGNTSAVDFGGDGADSTVSSDDSVEDIAIE